MKINFVKTHSEAQLPKKNHPNPLTGDAGFDIFLVEDLIIEAGKSAIANVGLKLGFITEGYWFRIEGRSGLGFKRDLSPFLGIIDNSYRNKIGIKIYNNGSENQTIQKGEAIAQIIPYEMISCEVGFQNEVSATDNNSRGEKGFGSSDKVKNKCVMVCGTICSGKTTYINDNIKENERHIKLGELVRKKHNTETRIFDNTLDDYLTKEVQKIISENPSVKTFYVDGCRQISLHKKLTALFDESESVWINTKYFIAKERYSKRRSKKDCSGFTFDEALKNDIKLGLSELRGYFENTLSNSVTFIKN